MCADFSNDENRQKLFLFCPFKEKRDFSKRCVIRQVKDTSSVNRGRYFYVCSRANGAPDNPQARCVHFQWKEIKKKTTTSTN